MAVAIAKYIQPNRQAKGKAKRTIRYNEHRPGKDGERLWRTLFNADGRLTRQEGYEMVDNADPGSVYWRIKISPDPVKEDTNRDLAMPEITERAMNDLQQQLGRDIQWIAAVHADHKPHRHIHVLAILPKLSSHEFRSLPDILIKGATDAALSQRQELDLVRDHRQKEQEKEDAQWQRQQEKGGT